MYYLQSRYYDPEVGRFINCDDVNYIGVTGSEVSYNPFAYCENNSVNGWDPVGNIAITTVLKTAIGALLGAAAYIIEWFVDKYILKNNVTFKVGKLLINVALGAIDGLISTKKVNDIISFVVTFTSNLITTISSEYSILEVFTISLIISLVSTLISNKITKGSISLKKISKYDKQVSSAWKKSIKTNNFKIIRLTIHKYFKRMNGTFNKYITSSLLSSMFGTAYIPLRNKIKGAIS